MGFVLGLITITLGLLAASSLIASWSRDAGAVIEKLRPVQGWFGVVGAVAGIIFLVRGILHLGGAMKAAGIGMMIPLIGSPLVLASVGFLMGFSMISGMLANSRQAQQRANELYHTLTPFQVPLGLVAVVLGVWTLIA